MHEFLWPDISQCGPVTGRLTLLTLTTHGGGDIKNPSWWIFYQCILNNLRGGDAIWGHGQPGQYGHGL